MLFSLIDNLEKVDVILASTSPRRFELLKTIGLEFRVVGSNVKENEISGADPIGDALENAKKKGRAVAQKHPDSLIISADTIVISGDKVMGKPANENDAYNMLKNLSGRTHQVCTAFGLIYLKYERSLFDTVKTDVTFRKLTDEEIWAYINTGEPLDKAGAYAVQGQGAVLVEKINGCYFNVVGFPLSKFFINLDEFLSHFVLK
jgi:septum formation protein